MGSAGGETDQRLLQIWTLSKITVDIRQEAAKLIRGWRVELVQATSKHILNDTIGYLRKYDLSYLQIYDPSCQKLRPAVLTVSHALPKPDSKGHYWLPITTEDVREPIIFNRPFHRLEPYDPHLALLTCEGDPPILRCMAENRKNCSIKKVHDLTTNVSAGLDKLKGEEWSIPGVSGISGEVELQQAFDVNGVAQVTNAAFILDKKSAG